MSAARRASNTCTRMPNPCAAVSTALSCRAPVVGSHSTPTPESVGTVSMRSCRHFALKSGSGELGRKHPESYVICLLSPRRVLFRVGSALGHVGKHIELGHEHQPTFALSPSASLKAGADRHCPPSSLPW